MPSPKYIKGVRFEREVVNNARKRGDIAFRSAGSHSPIDVVVIDEQVKTIYFIQCKDSVQSFKNLMEKFNRKEHAWTVVWKVMQKNEI